jgi:flagellar protein FliS
MRDPYDQYRSTSVAGKNQLELLLMLYDGALGFLRQARVHIAQAQVEPAHGNLVKAKRIVLHLISQVDPARAPAESRDLVTNLRRLYAFCFERIGAANLKKDTACVDHAVAVLERLRQGWAELASRGTWSPRAAAAPDQATIDIAQA